RPVGSAVGGTDARSLSWVKDPHREPTARFQPQVAFHLRQHPRRPLRQDLGFGAVPLLIEDANWRAIDDSPFLGPHRTDQEQTGPENPPSPLLHRFLPASRRRCRIARPRYHPKENCRSWPPGEG